MVSGARCLIVCFVGLAGCTGTALGPGATTDEGFFFSGSTRLSYALDIPTSGSPPYPLIVFGHDSSPEDKTSRRDWARRFVDTGVAGVLKSESDVSINRVFTIRFPDESAMSSFFADSAYMAVKSAHFDRSVSDTVIIATYEPR